MQEMEETWVQSLGWEDPWRRRWQPTPVFLPGESQGQKSLVGYSPWGHKRVGHGLATKQQQHVNPKLPHYPSPIPSPVTVSS